MNGEHDETCLRLPLPLQFEEQFIFGGHLVSSAALAGNSLCSSWAAAGGVNVCHAPRATRQTKGEINSTYIACFYLPTFFAGFPQDINADLYEADAELTHVAFV